MPAKRAPQHPSLDHRSAGILLHITSLPSPYGVGDLGPAAFEFIDFLEKSGQRWWQMLPLGPAGLGNSPYQAYSAFAGNSLLISPEQLHKEGYLTREEIASPPAFSKSEVNYTRVSPYKHKLLGLAFARFLKKPAKDFEAFQKKQDHWLEDYAFFAALQQLQKGAPWLDWQDALRRRDPNALKEARKQLDEKVLFQKFVQYQFFRQWDSLKEYAASKGIGLIGDIPIFVALDSADVWAHPEIFRLNPNGRPSVVAGVPPDMFSKTGQRWGNPLYDWDTLHKQNYAWWIQRLKTLFQAFDVVRIDHFIGFYRFWEIPASEETAIKGVYVPGPGAAFFEEVFKQLPKAAFIAEDLGVLIPEVTALRKQFGFPGMSVLQFAFSGDPEKNPYLPEKLEAETVVYTGTHDNDTTEGWFADGASPEEKKYFEAYLKTRKAPVHQELMEMAYASVANTAIIPLQDILGLGSEARMNFPGRLDGNWKWRMEPGVLTDPLARQLKKSAATAKR